MTNASKKIDLAFAKFDGETKEIVNTIRALIHKTDPTIKEGWKWGPAFEKNKLMMGLWGFKNHVSFVFYRGAEMSDKHKLFNYGFDNAHNRVIKFTSRKEVNGKKLADYIKEAVKIDAAGKMSLKRSVEISSRKLDVPADLKTWLSKNKKAKTHFDSLAFTYKKEMVLLLNTAKQEETRKRRMKKVQQSLLAGNKTI